MTSGAQTFVPVLHAPTVGSASCPVNVQVTKSGEFATGTCFPPLFVENAYQVPSSPLTKDGSGKLLVITGPVIPRLSMATAETKGRSNREETNVENIIIGWGSGIDHLGDDARCFYIHSAKSSDVRFGDWDHSHGDHNQ